VETSEIINAQGVRGDRENMFDMVVELADKVTRGVELEPLSNNIIQERKDIKLSEEAVRLYTKGLFYAERGDNDRAIELFSQVTREFPEYTPAHEALRLARAARTGVSRIRSRAPLPSWAVALVICMMRPSRFAPTADTFWPRGLARTGSFATPEVKSDELYATPLEGL
jgi:tetratricopeptide (TPR) repeat protein